MEIIDTDTGEDLIVGPTGHEHVTLSVRCPTFGAISHVRMTHDQVASLAGVLAGIVLDGEAAGWRRGESNP